MRWYAVLLVLAVAASLGIECLKGNVDLLDDPVRLPAVMERVEGRNCPLYYPDR